MRKWSTHSSRTPLQMRSRVRPNISRVMAGGSDRPATASHDRAGVARSQACAHNDGNVGKVSCCYNSDKNMWLDDFLMICLLQGSWAHE